MHPQTLKTKRNVARLVEKLWDFKKEKGCARCPENFPPCLEFHHKKGRKGKKDKCVSALAHGTGSWNRMMLEVKKCILLCANCHRKETYRLGRRAHIRKKYKRYGMQGQLVSQARRQQCSP